MEKNRLKDSSHGNKQMKYSWNSNSNKQGCVDDYLGGVSWPPRSYTCSFCKREYRSAQALGGHMNVHRRDRARLKQSPPGDGQCTLLNLNLNVQPNPNNPPFPFTCMFPSPVSPPSPPPPPALTLSAFSSPSLASSSRWVMDKTIFQDPLSYKSSDTITKSRTRERFYDGFAQEDECKFLKKAEIVRLELEVGLVGDSKNELDLELRLGYS